MEKQSMNFWQTVAFFLGECGLPTVGAFFILCCVFDIGIGKHSFLSLSTVWALLCLIGITFGYLHLIGDEKSPNYETRKVVCYFLLIVGVGASVIMTLLTVRFSELHDIYKIADITGAGAIVTFIASSIEHILRMDKANEHPNPK